MRRVLVFVSLFLILLSTQGQTPVQSPYSSFGLGELQFQKSFRNMGMGGLGLGVRNHTMVNEMNPASYTAADSLSFIVEASLFSNFSRQKTTTQAQTGSQSSMGHLAFGFPVTRWWAVGAGLKPFSSVGYKVREQYLDDTAGTTHMVYEGNGGINQVFIGTAFQPFRGFSVGANVSYLFGVLEQHTTVYSDTAHVFVTNRNSADQVKGWHLSAGAQYTLRLGDHSHLTTGLVYGLEANLEATNSVTIQRMLSGTNIRDTISFKENPPGELNIPVYYGAGLFAQWNRHWGAGLDFHWQEWENHRMLDRNPALNNTYRLAFGVRHNPDVQTFSTAFARLEYRAGIRYGQTYYKPYGHAINEFGMAFGLGVPFGRGLSALNIGFEFSGRGSTDSNLIREHFYRIHIGVNVYERWFIRHRFF